MQDIIVGWIVWVFAHFPFFAPVLGVLALAAPIQAVMKLAMTFLHDVVKVTPSQYDDNLLASWEQSKFYTVLCYLLDFFARIKLPALPAAAPVAPAEAPKK